MTRYDSLPFRLRGFKVNVIFLFLGLTQLAYFSCRVCDEPKKFERSNETCCVTHQPLIVTRSFSPDFVIADLGRLLIV